MTVAAAPVWAQRAPETDQPDVTVVQQTIEGEPFFALIPDRSGPDGIGIMIAGYTAEVDRRGRQRLVPLEQEAFDALLQRAQQYRERFRSWSARFDWSRQHYAIRTEHFDVVTDIDSMRIYESRERPSIPEILVTYGQRAEWIWNDFEANFGPIEPSDFSIMEAMRVPGDSYSRFTILMHDTLQDCARTDQVQFNDRSNPGPTRGMGLATFYWNRQTILNDQHLWETFTKNVAGMFGSIFQGAGRNQGSIPGWLDEGFGFFLVRLRRELDSHSTWLYSETTLGETAHIDGGTWRSHSRSSARRVEDEEIRRMLSKNVSSLSRDERIWSWAMVSMLVETSQQRAEETIQLADGDRDRVVTLEEWLADPLRHDLNGDLEIDDDERREAERQFNNWDLNDDGEISQETEAVAHEFRRFLAIQKIPRSLTTEEALREVYGWSEQDVVERWRAWIEERRFVDEGNIDLARITSWRSFESAFREVLASEEDEMRLARAIFALGRFQTRDAVVALAEAIEFFEERTLAGDMERPIEVYEAVRRVVAVMRSEEAVEGLQEIILDGRTRGGRVEHLAARALLVRGLGLSTEDWVLDFLSEVLDHEAFALRIAALDAIGELGVAAGADRLAGEVLERLDDDVRSVRTAAVQTLTRISDRQQPERFLEIMTALTNRFRRESGLLREEIHRALQTISGTDQIGRAHV